MKPISTTSISNVNPTATTSAREALRPKDSPGSLSFREHLRGLQDPTARSGGLATLASGLKFSNHAIDRMRARGVRFSPDELTKIAGAVHKAAAKGAKNTLLLTDNSALIVSVKDNTVVTVMDKAALKDNVFTNIDSTVMI